MRFAVQPPEREQVVVGFEKARHTAHAVAEQLQT
jgi:hypothetical protein